MTEKRYYEKNYDELYYIFDSKTLSEKEFEKKVEYDDYDLFADSLTSKEVVDLLNENEKLKEEKYAYLGEITLYKGEANKRKKENEQLKKENEELKTSKEYWREKCLSKDSYNKLYHKAPIWFTQSAKLTDKQANEIAEAIEQDLKERRIKK